MEDLFGQYEGQVTLWHKIKTFPNEFGPKEARFYMESELMLRQEMHETSKAFVRGDYKEVLDGILDIYWEVIPVYNYFRNLYKYWVHHGYEPTPCECLRDEFLVLIRGFTKLDLNYHHDEACAIRMVFRIKLLCERMLETLFSYETVKENMKRVCASNLSKFPAELSAPQVDLVQAKTAQALGEQVNHHYALIKDSTGYAITYSVFTCGAGKVKKPVGYFFQPSIQITEEEIARLKEFWDGSPTQTTLSLELP